MKRRGFIQALAGLPLLGGLQLPAQEPEKQGSPFIPTLWAHHAAAVIDRKLAKHVTREFIEVDAREGDVCNFGDGRSCKVDHIYGCWDFFDHEYNEYDIIEYRLVPMAEFIASEIIKRAGEGGHVVTYHLPCHRSKKPLSQRARVTWADLAVHGLLFEEGSKKFPPNHPNMYCGVIEVMAAYNPK